MTPVVAPRMAPPVSTPPPLTESTWHQPTQQLRRLQRVQAIALAIVCVASIAFVAVLGRSLMRNADRQTDTTAQLTSLMSIRDTMTALETAIWRSRAEATPFPLQDFTVGYMRFRAEALRLADERAGGDGAEVSAARTRVLNGIRQVDDAAAKLAAGDLSVDEALRITDAPAAELRAGMTAWTEAASEEINATNAASRRTSRQLFWSFAGLIALLLVGGTILWVLVNRARNRLVTTLEESEIRFRSLVQRSSDAVLVVGPDRNIRYASQPAERLFGYTPEELLGLPLQHLVHPDDSGPMHAFAYDGEQCHRDTPIGWTVRHRDGGKRYFESMCADLTADETIGGVVLNSRDVTDRHEIEVTLEHRAFHDALTDLANRALFKDRVDHALELMRRNGGIVAVLIIDLDDFKTVNDSLGHSAGDALLVELADRLRGTLRSQDTPARLGGDEFAVLIESCRRPEEVMTLGDRLGEIIGRPMQVEGHTLITRASIGIRITVEPDLTAADMLRDADVAMYAAKARGGSGVSVFEEAMTKQAAERLALITDIDSALEHDEFSLVYQPSVDIRTERIHAVEALARWRNPARGMIGPNVFIPLAEETGQIVAIGNWVLDRAIAQMADWNARLLPTTTMRMAVNVSVRQLEDPTFARTVEETLRRHGLPPTRLALEVTEHAIARDPKAVTEQLSLLRRTGVLIAIDDFGTGYSSLAYLADLPIDVVKIDRGFIADLQLGRRSSRLAETVIRIGRSLHLVTVAEGVEDPHQLEILRSLGCSRAQGYLFSRPVPPDELEHSLMRGTLSATARIPSET